MQKCLIFVFPVFWVTGTGKHFSKSIFTHWRSFGCTEGVAAPACHDSETMTHSASGLAEDGTVSSFEMCEIFLSESGPWAPVKGGNGKELGSDWILDRCRSVMEGDFL